MKKKLTLIELIIIVIILGLLVGLAIPKFTGVKADADVQAFRKDIDVLETVSLHSYIKDDELPIGAKVTGLNDSVMDAIYAFGGGDDDLYRIDFTKASKYLERLKNKETETDFYVYSKNAERVFYTKGFIDSKGRIYHTLDYVGLKNLAINSTKLKNKMFVYETDDYMLTGESVYGEPVKITINGDDVAVPLSVVKSDGFNIMAGDTNFNVEAPLEYGANEVYIGTENYGNEFTVFVINEDDVSNPIATIDMSPGTDIEVNIPIFFDYSNSFSPTGASIVQAEWVGKEDSYSTPGEKTVQLRVKDSNGLWSEWVSKTFIVGNITPELGGSVKSISVGHMHAIALMNDGTVRVWGYGDSGRLGLGNTSSVSVPTKIETLSNVKEVAASYAFSAALLEDGSVYTWGANNIGQLGHGDAVSRLVPTKVDVLSNINSIYVGYQHVYAKAVNGSVYGWGDNSYGLFGTGNLISSNTPIVLGSFSDVKEISTGWAHTVITKNDGTFWGVGSNAAGQFGINTTVLKQMTPVQITGISEVKKFVVGTMTTYAILNNGSVKSAGGNNVGQLGIGNIVNQKTFQDVLVVSDIVDITAYQDSTYFITSTGATYVAGTHWYSDTFGWTENKPRIAYTDFNLREVKTVGHQTYAIHKDGTVYSWGDTGLKAPFLIE